MATVNNFTQLLVDTGPLIAFFQKNDAHHAWVLEQIGKCSEPMLTCESVLSEALFLLKRQSMGTKPLAQMLKRGALCVPRQPDFAKRIPEALEKYADLPTSLADATLLELSEHYKRTPLMTFDSDFRIYRRRDRTVIPVLMP